MKHICIYSRGDTQTNLAFKRWAGRTGIKPDFQTVWHRYSIPDVRGHDVTILDLDLPPDVMHGIHDEANTVVNFEPLPECKDFLLRLDPGLFQYDEILAFEIHFNKNPPELVLYPYVGCRVFMNIVSEKPDKPTALNVRNNSVEELIEWGVKLDSSLYFETESDMVYKTRIYNTRRAA